MNKNKNQHIQKCTFDVSDGNNDDYGDAVVDKHAVNVAIIKLKVFHAPNSLHTACQWRAHTVLRVASKWSSAQWSQMCA